MCFTAIRLLVLTALHVILFVVLVLLCHYCLPLFKPLSSTYCWIALVPLCMLLAFYLSQGSKLDLVRKKTKEREDLQLPFVKVNADGSAKGNPGLSVTGGLIKDATTGWICGFTLEWAFRLSCWQNYGVFIMVLDTDARGLEELGAVPRYTTSYQRICIKIIV
ncbi:hypothetical protein COLO4_10195 [Corchorus olitorius]|uniref:Uncharacterized protein n=1 Tax=Corchorus olitorius TaxID=93759 RepID=A0A1R3K9V8_9ROSI|nr:hypothetical protein COLO4_10195 [Corchorus olitorius]